MKNDQTDWKVIIKAWVLALCLCVGSALADARQIDEYQWEGVERVVAIGDLHGDYDNYIEALKAAGLVDKRDKWSGGKTHLVQTGDIPDRGPDTLRIIEHIRKLGKQAKRKGGYVHNLIGNHEAMNVYGDLRYVSDGEFEAFVNRNSEKLRDRVFEVNLQRMEAANPEAYAALPENFRELWYRQHPLGWVEHRQSWDPAWNPDGEYADWVLQNKVSVRINGMLFLHGGISGFYCRNSLDSMTEKVLASLRQYDPENPGIVEDEFGPLWYRGLSGVEPVASEETVDAILDRHEARHIIVGHTVTSGVIWPQYGGKVVMIDTGISRAYGGYVAYLEMTPEGIFAGYPKGRLPLPMGEDDLVAYLEKVIAMDPENPYLQERLDKLIHPPVPSLLEDDAAVDAENSGEEAVAHTAPPRREIPICGISE